MSTGMIEKPKRKNDAQPIMPVRPVWMMCLLWIVGFIPAWFIGFPLVMFIVGLLFGMSASMMFGSSTAGVFGFLPGIILGGYFAGKVSWYVALQDRLPQRAWAQAGAIAVTLAMIGSILAPGLLPPAFTIESYDSGLTVIYHLTDTWLMTLLVTAAVLTLAFVGPHWYALRKYTCRAWILYPLVFLNFALIGYFMVQALLVAGSMFDANWLNARLPMIEGILLLPLTTALGLGMAGWNRSVSSEKSKNQFQVSGEFAEQG